jgi:hypothetical protein
MGLLIFPVPKLDPLTEANFAGGSAPEPVLYSYQ